MKKHETRLLKEGEEYFYYLFDKLYRFTIDEFYRVYVDSNNFVHNLNGTSYTNSNFYFIHGKEYRKKEWLIEREKLLLEQNRLDILEEL